MSKGERKPIFRTAAGGSWDHGHVLERHDDRLQYYGTELADLRARVQKLETDQERLWKQLGLMDKHAQERHEAIMAAITANKITGAIMDTKGRTAAAIFMGLGVALTALYTLFRIGEAIWKTFHGGGAS